MCHHNREKDHVHTKCPKTSTLKPHSEDPQYCPANPPAGERHDKMMDPLLQSSPDLKFTSQFPWPLSPLLYPKTVFEGPTSNDGFSNALSKIQGDTDLKLVDIWNEFSQQLTKKTDSTGGRPGQEKELYTPIAVLLNILSLAQYSHLAEGNEKCKPLLWMVNNLRTLDGDILRTLAQPDIVVGHVDSVDAVVSYLKGLTSERDKGSEEGLRSFTPNFFRLASMVEVKTNASNHNQLLHYLSVQLRYRLDLSSAYGLHARCQGYRVAFLSPSRVSYSANFSWERLDALAHYVAVVYRREQRTHADFKQVEGTKCSWSITVNKKTYIGEQFFASFPLGRTTISLIVVDTSREHGLLFLKTYYVNSTSRFREEQLYKVAHGDHEKSGYIQGLALLVSAKEYVEYQLHGGSMGVPRTKCVVVLGSIGRPLSTCSSVLSLLKVIYDATVTLEEMAKNGVMHRDINRGNIMCSAIGVSKLHGVEVQFKNSSYIERTLYDIQKGDNQKIGVCHALVADLDHAENMAQNDGATGRGRTGTAMYMATELAGDEYEYEDPTVDSCRITLLAKYLQDVIRKTGAKFSDSFHKTIDDLDTAMAYSTTEEVKQLEQRQNLPRHDVESLFWVLVFALLRALPKGAKDHECATKAQYSYNAMVYHFLTRSMDITTDARVRLLRGALRWKAVLHTKLHPLSGMLNAMGNLFSIDWSSRIRDKRSTFIHESFKCILLGEIDRLICGGDINIHTEFPRDAETNKDSRVKLRKNLNKRNPDKITQYVSQIGEPGVNGFTSKKTAIMGDWINDELWMSMKGPKNVTYEGEGNQLGLFIPAGENPIEFKEEKER